MYALGGGIKYQISEITPTYLSLGVLKTMKEVDDLARKVLRESGKLCQYFKPFYLSIHGHSGYDNKTAEWLVPLIHLNTITRMLFEILFVMLVEAVAFSFALGIERLHENINTAKYSGSCIQLT